MSEKGAALSKRDASPFWAGSPVTPLSWRLGRLGGLAALPGGAAGRDF